MKRLFASVLCMGAFLSVPLAMADCGKMIIIPRPPIRICPPRVSVEIWQRHLTVTETLIKAKRFGGGGYYDTLRPDMIGGGYGGHYIPGSRQPRIINPIGPPPGGGGTIFNPEIYDSETAGPGTITGMGTDGTVGVPPVTDQYSDAGFYGGGIFNENDQQGVIAWNGKEEILVLSTNEHATEKVGSGAMISMMPLPGKPLNIMRANKEIFNKATQLLNSKMPEDAGTYGVFMQTEIGAHKIFVWKLDTIVQFEDEINAFVAETYGKDYSVNFDSKTKTTIEDYFKRGFRYFAFDLTMVGTGESTKEAIAYHFESQYVFFPTVISASGGKGPTRIKLSVFTSGDLKTFGGLKPGDKDYEIFIPGSAGKRSVDVTSEELKSLDPSFPKLFGNQGAKGRFFIITGELDKFEKDVIVF